MANSTKVPRKFAILGDRFSGLSIWYNLLNRHPKVKCYPDISLAEEHYANLGFVPFSSKQMSLESYLSSMVFNRPPPGRPWVGVVISYESYYDQQLNEFLSEWGQRGDFSVIHVLRNPAKCYRDRLVAASGGHLSSDSFLEIPNLVSYVRRFAATAISIDRAVEDQATVMMDTHLDEEKLKHIYSKLLGYLNLEEEKVSFSDIAERVSRVKEPNFELVKNLVPADVRDWLFHMESQI